MSLRDLIYSQSQGTEYNEDDEEEGQRHQQTQEEQERDEVAAAATTGLLEAAIWRRTMNRFRSAPESVKWRGLRPSRGAPLYHWPTSLLADCQNRPALMHLTLLRKLLVMCLAVRDVPSVAATLRLIQELQPRVDVASLEANTWLLTRLAEREAAATAKEIENDHVAATVSTSGSQPHDTSTDPTSRPYACRLLLFLRNVMGGRIELPMTAGDVVGEQPKAVAPPDYLRVLALSKLLNFLISGGYLGYAQDLVRQEAFLRPFGPSPHVLAIRALLPCLEAARTCMTEATEVEEGEEEDEEESGECRGGKRISVEAAFARMVRDPSKFFTAGLTNLQSQHHQQREQHQHHQQHQRRLQRKGVEALIRDLDKALATGVAPSGVLAVRIGLLRLRGDAKDRRTVLRAVHANCQTNPDSPRAQQLGYMALKLVKGQDDEEALGFLKRWVRLDPTADEAVGGVVHAFRRQLLRSYRDPTTPVLISRARLVRALVDRLLTLLPPSSSSFSSSSSASTLHLHLKYFRWLAMYLGPVPEKQREEEEEEEEKDEPREEGVEETNDNLTRPWKTVLSSIDWFQRANVQGVLAGRYEAWSPACRGLEESASLDLFEPMGVRGERQGGREDAFLYNWYEILKEEAAEEESGSEGRKRTRQKRTERDALWAAVKYSRTGLHDQRENEEDENEEGEHGRAEGHGANYRHDYDDEDTESEDEDDTGGPIFLQHGKDDADDLLLETVCGRTDDKDNDPPLPPAAAAEEPLLPPSLRQGLLLLTYKAVVAAHFMGPQNPYTIFAVRSLWEKTQGGPLLGKRTAAPPALAPHFGHWLLFSKLRGVFGIDVRASLLLSDGYILAMNQVQVPPHLSLLPMEEGRAREGPLNLGLAEAACGWPLPALHPPRVLPPAAAAAGAGEAVDGMVFRPRPLPMATARASQVLIRRAFSKAKRDREQKREEKEGKEKRQKCKRGSGGGNGQKEAAEKEENEEEEEEENACEIGMKDVD